MIQNKMYFEFFHVFSMLQCITWLRRDGSGGGFFVRPEHDLLHLQGPAAVRLAETTGEHVDDGLREVDAAGFQFRHIRRLDATGDEEHAHVANDFRRGRDFHDVAEEVIHLAVAARDFGPARADPDYARDGS